jgi:hypothetical protein
MEYLLLTSVTALRHAVGAGFRLREAQFRHRRAGGRNEAERSFGCPVSFGQRDDGIVFPHSALWTTTRFANRSIGERSSLPK